MGYMTIDIVSEQSWWFLTQDVYKRQSFTYVCEDDCKAISGWEKEKDQNRTDVTSYKRKLNKASLYVSVMLADTQQLGNDLGFIKTELSYIADQKLSLIHI